MTLRGALIAPSSLLFLPKNGVKTRIILYFSPKDGRALCASSLPVSPKEWLSNGPRYDGINNIKRGIARASLCLFLPKNAGSTRLVVPLSLTKDGG